MDITTAIEQFADATSPQAIEAAVQTAAGHARIRQDAGVMKRLNRMDVNLLAPDGRQRPLEDVTKDLILKSAQAHTDRLRAKGRLVRTATEDEANGLSILPSGTVYRRDAKGGLHKVEK